MGSPSQKLYKCSCVYKCNQFTQADTELLYHEYNAIDKECQFEFLGTYIIEKPPKSGRSTKGTKFYFYLPTIDGFLMPVCQKKFCYTFRLSNKDVRRLSVTSYALKQETVTTKEQSKYNGNAAATKVKNGEAEEDKTLAAKRVKLTEAIDEILLLLLPNGKTQGAKCDNTYEAVEGEEVVLPTLLEADALNSAADSAEAELKATNELNTSCDSETATGLVTTIPEDSSSAAHSEGTAAAAANEPSSSQEEQSLASGYPLHLLLEQDIEQLKLTVATASLASAVAAAIEAATVEKQAELVATQTQLAATVDSKGIAAGITNEPTTSSQSELVAVEAQLRAAMKTAITRSIIENQAEWAAETEGKSTAAATATENPSTTVDSETTEPSVVKEDEEQAFYAIKEQNDEQLELKTIQQQELKTAIVELVAAITAEITLAAVEFAVEEKFAAAIATEEFNTTIDLEGPVAANVSTTSHAKATAATEQTDTQPTTAAEQVTESLLCFKLEAAQETDITKRNAYTAAESALAVIAAKEVATAEAASTTEDSEVGVAAAAAAETHTDPTATATSEAKNEQPIESNIVWYTLQAAADDDQDEFSFTDEQMTQTESDMLDNAVTAVQELRIRYQMLMYRKSFK